MNLTENALALTRLIGKKELEFGCLFSYEWRKWIFKVNWDYILSTLDRAKVNAIGVPCTIDDVFRWAKRNWFAVAVNSEWIKSHLSESGGHIFWFALLAIWKVWIFEKTFIWNPALPLHHPDNDQACKELVDFISNYKE